MFNQQFQTELKKWKEAKDNVQETNPVAKNVAIGQVSLRDSRDVSGLRKGESRRCGNDKTDDRGD